MPLFEYTSPVIDPVHCAYAGNPSMNRFAGTVSAQMSAAELLAATLETAAATATENTRRITGTMIARLPTVDSRSDGITKCEAMFACMGARRRWWGRVMVLAAVTSVAPLSGCSFLFLDRPRDYGRSEKIDCTTSYTLPVVDVAFALLHLVSLGVLASASGDAYGGEKSREAFAQVDILWLTMHGVSAGWGLYKVGECKDLVADDAGSSPSRAAPRPRPRPVAPRANPPPEPPAQQPAPPVEPVPAAPVAAPPQPAPAPPAARVPQKADDE
jgi:hypothetical protein